MDWGLFICYLHKNTLFFFSEKYNEFNPRSRLFLDFGMEMPKNFPTKPCEKETN